jgi:hypothetical protein
VRAIGIFALVLLYQIAGIIEARGVREDKCDSDGMWGCVEARASEKCGTPPFGIYKLSSARGQ